MASREWYAARRAQGLCVNCPMPSARFWRCAFCRLDGRAQQRRWEQHSYRRHRLARAATARAKYAERPHAA